MQATVEEKNDSLEYSFLNKIGAPIPKSKLIGKRICDIFLVSFLELLAYQLF